MATASFFNGPQRIAVRLLAWLLLAAPLATAQPTLVKDIVPTGTEPLTGPASFQPASLVSLDGTVYFSAFDPRYGRELWRSNGTPAGTVLLKDIIAGATGSGPADLAVVNNTLYFTADDGQRGRELWKSDGTSSGTVRVKDISPGALGSNPAHLTAVGSTLYFAADDGASGPELWKSDGTSSGTVRVKDIAPGAGGSGPQVLTPMNGTLYFLAEDAAGRELWKSNGTAAGTVRVKDILPGAGSPFGYGAWGYYTPPSLAVMNGILYFNADDEAHGFELWRSDGTAAGTYLVLDIAAGDPGSSDGHSFPGELTAVNGTLYFAATGGRAGRELWRSDGTAAGTTLHSDIEPGFETYIESFNSSNPGELTNVNGTLYFAATSGYAGRELWKSDASGTVMVKDMTPDTEYVPHPYRPGFGWNEPIHSNPTELTNVNGTLYFVTADGLWKSDGTDAGTVLLKPILAASHLVNNAGTLFLAGSLANQPMELWKSNGTEATTVLAKGAPASMPGGANPQQTLNVNGTLYFVAGNETSGYALWKSTGTNAGTTLVKQVGPGLNTLTNANGKVFFLANDGTNGPALWKSDGTAAGTGMVKDFSATNAGVQNLTAVNGVVYFAAYGELWKSDGTAAGTKLVKDIYPGGYYEYNSETYEEVYYPYHSNPEDLTALNGVLYFRANSPAGKGELWRSDGTNAGTYLVKDINSGIDYENKPEGAEIRHLTAVNGILYFSADDGSSRQLWKSNGTNAGTVMLKDVTAHLLRRAGNGIYFWVESSSSNWELWKSDGTTPGTVPVKALDLPTNNPVPQFLAAVGNVMYFTTVNTTYGQELWKSDGTGAGTNLVKDLVPGTAGSEFTAWAVLGSELYLATGPAGGIPALWKSNGTSAGTVKVSSLSPSSLAVMNNVLYFTANDGRTGYELWKYNPATCVAASAALAVQGGSVCLGSPATVTVKAAQAGVRYQAYFGASALGLSQVGNGGDLTFAVPAASLLAGTYTFTVKAEGCREVALTQTATVTVTTPLTAPTANGATVSSGQTATLTASGAPTGSTYRWYGAAAGGTPLATTASFTTPALTATTTYYVAAYGLPCGESPRRAVTVTVSGSPAPPAFRVNAGGNAFSTIDARNFAADAYFAGGSVSTATTLASGGSGDDYLYQTGRHGSSFSYNFPTGNGSYDVVLHFAETYFGNTAPGGIGSRRFHVNLEGVRKLTDYDVFAKAGGALKATQETFRVNVADGTLTVSFLKGAADNPAIKAIEVLPAGSALTINAGGPAFTTSAGKRFSADVYYASGTVSSIASGDVLNTSDDALYRTARVGVFSYGLPSGNGTFDVTLHFAETYWGSRATGGVGSRKFNVFVENVKRLSEYDVFAKAGGAMRAVKETVRVTVTDGILNLYFAKGTADNPMLSALEVVAVTAPAKVAAAGEADEAGPIRLYPNPVRDKLHVALPFPAQGVRGTAVTDARGTVLLSDGHRVSGENALEIGTGTLPKGLFLLQIHADGGSYTSKFVKE
jgi:ELWxxDGT repeat protein